MSNIDRNRTRRASAIGALLILSASAFAADWDITDTGQPYTEVKLTVTEGTWMSLDVSPDGKRLVFDMLGDIYALPASGGTATLLHGGPAMEHNPRFSPDGSKILYVSDRGGSENLWMSNADGSGARQVTHETVNTVGAPVWDAAGRYAVAAKFYPQMAKFMGAEIWLYHLDGGQGRLVVPMPKSGKPVNEPQLSHDGRYLYYSENIALGGPMFINTVQPNFGIKRRDLRDGKLTSRDGPYAAGGTDAGAAEDVVSGFGSATTPQVSPDDRRVAFIRRVKDKTTLFVYDLDSGAQRPVYDKLDRDQYETWNPRNGSLYPQFAWFPDNRHVAIWSGGRLHKIDMDTQALEEIPFQATADHRITVPPRFEQPLAPEQFTAQAIQQVAVASDGKNAVFNALGHLWRKQLPGGKPQRLTQTGRFEFEPSYSSDGTALVYVSWDDERGGALELMNTRSRAVKTLLKGPGIIRQPALSPDGKNIVYWLEQGNKKMGGYRAVEPGLYSIPAAGGQPRFIGAAAGIRYPQFSPDGKRIYYVARALNASGVINGSVLESVDLNGLDKRQHVVSEETTEFRISPDLSWLAYKKDLQYYLIPYRETGAALRLTKAGAEMPAPRLTDRGGYEITWSADSRRLHWLLGQTLFSASVADRVSADVKPAVVPTTLGLQVPVDKPQGAIAFANGRIITMKGDEVIERGTIVIDGNRIVAVGPAGSVAIPKAAKVIDVSGKTLMPGLIDMHGHLDIGEDDYLMPQKQPSHYAALAFGTTTNFDPSGAELPGYAAGEMKLAGVTVGPRSITAGHVVYGMDSLGGYNPINSYEDARNIIQAKKALGGIIVKSYLQPMRSQRQQVIKAGREFEVMVTPEGERNFYNNITMILDGHVSIEHNFFLAGYYQDLLQLLARGGTSVTPTMIVSNGAENYFYQTTRPWDDPKIKTYVQTTFATYSPLGSAPEAPPYARGMVGLHQAEEIWNIGFRAIARAVKKVDDAGAVVTVGAHGQIHGLGMHWEMWARAEGGMSPYRILRAATLNGAKTIGLDKQIGTLEAGKLADLIVLDANPLENIRNTNTVRYSMVNGRLYDSPTMNEIGNYDRPRTRFYWELPDYKGIDWNEAWGGPGVHR